MILKSKNIKIEIDGLVLAKVFTKWGHLYRQIHIAYKIDNFLKSSNIKMWELKKKQFVFPFLVKSTYLKYKINLISVYKLCKVHTLITI